MDPTLQWLYAAEADGGGISAWKTPDGQWQKPYPEVTGYLLPTLIRWGAMDLAERCCDWLLDIQNDDGSWSGMDHVHRPFDTSAIIEGLRYMDRDARKAEKFIKSLISPEGYIFNCRELHQPETYNLRASAIIGHRGELEYRQRVGFPVRERSHYLAYALEGALNLGAVDWVRPILEQAHENNRGLISFWVNRDWTGDGGDADLCATAQMGILFLRVGLDAHGQYEAISRRVEPNGGIPQGIQDPRQLSWGAKFWLDFKEAYCG